MTGNLQGFQIGVSTAAHRATVNKARLGLEGSGLVKLARDKLFESDSA
jgi:hypothetical protein